MTHGQPQAPAGTKTHWLAMSIPPRVGQQVILKRAGVVQPVMPVLDQDEGGFFWNFHGLAYKYSASQCEDHSLDLHVFGREFDRALCAVDFAQDAWQPMPGEIAPVAGRDGPDPEYLVWLKGAIDALLGLEENLRLMHQEASADEARRLSEGYRIDLRHALRPIGAQNLEDESTATSSASQEPKYAAVAGSFVNRASGREIPDEPVFLFRAKDRWAIDALRAYHDALPEGAHREAVARCIQDFDDFRRKYPSKVGAPSTATAQRAGETEAFHAVETQVRTNNDDLAGLVLDEVGLRSLFEDWAKGCGLPLTRQGEGYQEVVTGLAWQTVCDLYPLADLKAFCKALDRHFARLKDGAVPVPQHISTSEEFINWIRAL